MCPGIVTPSNENVQTLTRQLPLSKRSYIGLVRGIRGVLRRTGIVSWLDEARDRHFAALYWRSLLAIHDPLDLMRLDLPWWTFAAIRRVERTIASWDGQARVFEYGCGASTAWLARRCSYVRSVEHDPRFAEEMSRHLSGFDNVEIECIEAPTAEPPNVPAATSTRPGAIGRDFRRYVEHIRQGNSEWDLIIIDGRARAACLREAVKHVSPGGCILFDNSNRLRYSEALAACSLDREVFLGATPTLPYPDETTLLWRGHGPTPPARKNLQVED